MNDYEIKIKCAGCNETLFVAFRTDTATFEIDADMEVRCLMKSRQWTVCAPSNRASETEWRCPECAESKWVIQ